MYVSGTCIGLVSFIVLEGHTQQYNKRMKTNISTYITTNVHYNNEPHQSLSQVL